MSRDVGVVHMWEKCLAASSMCLAGWTLAEVREVSAVVASCISILLGTIYLGEWAYKRFIRKVAPGDTGNAPLE